MDRSSAVSKRGRYREKRLKFKLNKMYGFLGKNFELNYGLTYYYYYMTLIKSV